MPATLTPPQPPSAKLERVKHGDDIWFVRRGLPVFDEHTARDGTVYTPELLDRIASNCNERYERTGDACPLIVGHTGPDREKPIVGYALNFRTSRVRSGKSAIVADFYYRSAEIANSYSRRSVEVWNQNPEERFFDPIALLGGTTPKLDLGIVDVYHRAAGEQPIDFYEMATPGQFNTAPAAPMKRREDYSAGDDCAAPTIDANAPNNGGLLTDGQLSQIVQALLPMIRAEVEMSTRPIESPEPTLEESDFELTNDGADGGPMGLGDDPTGGPMGLDPGAGDDPFAPDQVAQGNPAMGDTMIDDQLPLGDDDSPVAGGPPADIPPGLDDDPAPLPEAAPGDIDAGDDPTSIPAATGDDLDLGGNLGADIDLDLDNLDLSGLQLPGDEDETPGGEFPPKKPQRFSRMSEGNMSSVNDDRVEQYQKAWRDEQSARVRVTEAHRQLQGRYARLEIEHDKLRDERDRLKKQLDETATKERYSRRLADIADAATKHSLALGDDGIDRQFQLMRDLPEDQYSRFLENMIQTSARVPVGRSVPANDEDARSAHYQREHERMSDSRPADGPLNKEESTRARELYQREKANGMTYSRACEQVRCERTAVV